MTSVSSQRKPVALVIGTGFGGLAAAVRLGARGYASRCWSASTRPAAARYQHKIDGFTFDAGPTIVTAPFLFEELWALCGRQNGRRRRPAARWTRSTSIRFNDGEVFNYQRRPRRDARRGRALLARRRRGLRRASCARARRSTASASSSSATRLSIRSMDMVRIAPDLLRLHGYRSVYGARVALLQRRAAAHHFQLPSAADRRQSLPGHLDLLPDRLSRKALGRALRHRRHGRLVARARRAHRRPGQRDPLQGADVRRSWSRAALAVGVNWPAARGCAPTSSSPTPNSAYTYRSSAAAARAPALDRPQARALRNIPWACSSGISAPTAATTTSAITRILMGPRYKDLLQRHFPAQGAGGGFQPLPASPHRDRPVRRAAGLRRVLRALARAQPRRADRIGRRGRALSQAHRRPGSRRTLLPDLSKHIVTSRVTTPLDFRDRSSTPSTARVSGSSPC